MGEAQSPTVYPGLQTDAHPSDMENDDQRGRLEIGNVVSPDFSSPSSSFQSGLMVANWSYKPQPLLYTEPSRQSSTGDTAGSVTGSQQDSSDSDHGSSQFVNYESDGLPPLLEHKQRHPAELNRPSHSNSIYSDHGSCNADCKKYMYTAIMHYSQKDRVFADKVQSILENITLPFHKREYHARVTSLFPLTGNQPLEALHEIQQFEMTTNIIFICTKNYENDEKAKCTGRKIIDAACGTSLRVTQLICDSSTTAETGCASIFYNPESQSFAMDMATILLGKAFREQLIHDERRQRCEAKYSNKIRLRPSKSFVYAKGESPKPSFSRTNSCPSSAANPGKRPNVRTREGQRDARLSQKTNETRTNPMMGRKTRVSQAPSEEDRVSPDQRNIDTCESGHETVLKTIVNDSLLRPEQINNGPPDLRQPTDECENVSERAIPSGSDYHTIECENEESIESRVSSTSNDQKTDIERFNSMSTSSSEAHDGLRQNSKRPNNHFNDPSRSNIPQENSNMTKNLESTSSSQELQSDCSLHKIKGSSMRAKSYFSKNGGSESNGRPVASVSPMSSSFTDEYEDDHQTMQKTSWAAEQHQTEVSALHQQQDTGSHQNPPSQNQRTFTTRHSSSSQQHSSIQQVRQQTADVQQSPTDQQRGINPTRNMLHEEIAEVPVLQRSTQGFDSQEILSTSQTSGRTANRDIKPEDSAAKQHEDGGIQQQGRRSLLHRFTSMVTCALRRDRRKKPGAKGQKQKPP